MEADLSMQSKHGPEDSHELLGRIVKVMETGTIVRVGRVECVSPNGDLIWIEASGCEPRALYGLTLGHSVVPVE
jgi:hypothetical protein